MWRELFAFSLLVLSLPRPTRTTRSQPARPNHTMPLSAALTLYRNLLRTAHHYNSYYFSHYIARRTKEEFRKNRNVSESAARLLLDKAEVSLAVARRQATISRLYPREKLVIE